MPRTWSAWSRGVLVVGASACSPAVARDAGDAGSAADARDAASDAGARMDGAALPDAASPRDAATTDATTVDAADAADAGPHYARLPCNVTVGTGSGTLTVSAAGSRAGDVICVRAGSYSGGSITALSDRTLQNDGGQVVFTGVVEVGNLTRVTFSGAGDDAVAYGFQLSGPAASMVLTGPNRGLTVHHFEAVGAGIFLDAGHTSLTWSGDPSGLVLYQSLLDHIHLSHSGQLFQGNYGSVNLLVNFISDVEMSNVLVEDSAGVGQAVVVGAGIFNLNAHDWTVTAHNDVVVGSADDRDTGLFVFWGSGRVERIHRDGGWGWIVRNFGVQLGADRGEFHCENNVDLNTEYYGTCETRNDLGYTDVGTLVPGQLSSIDLFVQNNVSAHKRDAKADSYVTALALVPQLLADTTATIVNNVGCDNSDPAGDTDGVRFFGPIAGTVTQSGNHRLVSCAGLTDPITGRPL